MAYNIGATKEAIEAALLRVINADSAPTNGSLNMVNSSNIKAYVDALVAANTSTINSQGTRLTALEAKPQVTGWENHSDSQYTVGSPLAVNNARVRLTCNQSGSSQDVSHSPLESGAFWTSNEITPENDGDSYIIRLAFTADPSSTNAYFDIELDISAAKDGSTVILLDTIALHKGSNPQRVVRSYPIYVGATFAANNGAIFLDDTEWAGSLNVYDIGVHIQRTHAPG